MTSLHLPLERMLDSLVKKVLSSLSYSSEQVPGKLAYTIRPHGNLGLMTFQWKVWESQPRIFVGKTKEKMVGWRLPYQWVPEEARVAPFLQKTIDVYRSEKALKTFRIRKRQQFVSLAQEYADDPIFLRIYEDWDFYHLSPDILLVMMKHILEDLSSDIGDEDPGFARQIYSLSNHHHPMTVLVEAARLDESLFDEVLKRLVIALENDGITLGSSARRDDPPTGVWQSE